MKKWIIAGEYGQKRLVQFLDHMDLKKIEVNFFDKTVFAESGPGNALEFVDIGI